jgi:hypothetical protein
MEPLRIAILGCPAKPHVSWTRQNLDTLRQLGFNVLQLNIAWGSRPADEPLNLEDIVELPAALAAKFPQPVPLRCDPAPERRERRRRDLRERIALARAAGFRTLFHFGAPFNAHMTYGDNPPNCLSDPAVVRRYELLLEKFADEFPGVDDVLIYTYDQDAWLCNEFGDCPRCGGVPLHQRLVPFLERLRDVWVQRSPHGRLWWEPWELSAGQVMHCVAGIHPAGFGLMLHANVAEVMVALPVDRFVKNAAALAASRGIPVVLEGFLGAATEEVEPYIHLQSPLCTLRQVRALDAVPGAVGIKEYYGLLPDKEDPSLRATGLFFADPEISEDDALENLAAPYAPEGKNVVRFWRLMTEAMELFPWDASWWLRCVGRSEPRHAMTAAYLRGQQAHTPSWESTRRAIFMKTDNEEPDPWLLEDFQLRLQLAAERMASALALGEKIASALAAEIRAPFVRGLEDLAGWRQRTLAYVYHVRATNLSALLRRLREQGRPAPEHLVRELVSVLEADRDNMKSAEPLTAALQLLQADLDAFLKTYFLPDRDIRHSFGDFTVTSR